MHFENNVCPSCGASIDVNKITNGVVQCDFCQSYFTAYKEKPSPAALAFLRQGEHNLDTCKFDDAYTAYAKAAELAPSEPEAYFGMALASFKVQFLKDEVADPPRIQPICHEISEKAFSDDAHYKRALELATMEQKRVYRAQATEIDDIRDQFAELKKSGLNYDCFICAKVTETDGSRTGDCDRANDIYYHLKDQGCQPFFSEREMKNRTGADYEALILYALSTSKCMIIVCSDEEYLHTKWVKNEYTRFLKMVADGEKVRDAIAFAFYGTPVEKLPGRSGKLQGIDLSRPDAYSRVDNFVKAHLHDTSVAEPTADNVPLEEPSKNRAQFLIKNDELHQYTGDDRDVVIPEKVSWISWAAFQNKDITSVKIHGNVGYIHKDAFRDCKYLSSVIIEEGKGYGGLLGIGKYAFAGCTALTTIVLPSRVIELGRGAFLDCINLKNVVMPKKLAGIFDINLRRAFGRRYKEIEFVFTE